VGLSGIGSILLENRDLTPEFPLRAGFDSNINLLETLNTTVPLYPFHTITEIVKAAGIELAIVAVGRAMAQDSVDKLVSGGVRGILNLSSTPVSCMEENVRIHDFSVVEELRILEASFVLKDTESRRGFKRNKKSVAEEELK
jgi:redox-sensing transcriptional repressor